MHKTTEMFPTLSFVTALQAASIGVGLAMLALALDGALSWHLCAMISDSLIGFINKVVPPEILLLSGVVALLTVPLAMFLGGIFVLFQLALWFGRKRPRVPAGPAANALPTEQQEVARTSFWASLRHPLEQIIVLNEAKPDWSNAPYECWLPLTICIAVGAHVYATAVFLPLFVNLNVIAELSFYFAAGAFYLAGLKFLRINAISFLHACIVTSCYAAALAIGATVLNFACALLFGLLHLTASFYSLLNTTTAAAIAVFMLLVLNRLLAAIGLHERKQLALIWLLAFVVTGVCAFLLLSRSAATVSVGLQG